TLVATPIGNLGDISARALEVLGTVDLILAEDTRKTFVLLDHFNIKTRLKSFHKFNEHRVLADIIHALKDGKHLAMVSDAGTPGISDPGFLIVRECVKEDIEVEVLPGPVAFIPALVLSGISCDRFVFEGFLPRKKGRKTRIESLLNEERTIVLYESPHRLVKTLVDLSDVLGADRNASVSRELSKKFEETVRGTLGFLSQHFTDNSPRGELVLIVEGNK
ncbi:MAG: 16S rRNA (cytidine(1402)-2'-O)-methyltransferase, partial [Bacteroidales bacterium]